MLWRRHQTVRSKSWQIDETYIRVEGHLTYLYRAIDSNGFTLDFELQKYRDLYRSLSLSEASLDDQISHQSISGNFESSQAAGKTKSF
ncbi:hypothetical protein FC12_GL000579 [Lacticaseibacillus paracasei subsp. tolerans DSM 20258]|nr:hypothetical protein FC12_GL000579 [Lacticaseibacillus paracasei subsp. tolerans DSM 20258]